MEDYSLGLALFDFLPVLVSAFGLYLLAGLLARALPASRALLLAGFALILAGGVSKATWKLVWVLAQVDIAVLDVLLFVCIAPGMVLLAWHAAAASNRWRGGSATLHPGRNSLICIVPVLAAAAYLATRQPEGRAWFLLLLSTSTLANIALSVVLIRLSMSWNQRLTATIFLVGMLLTMSLGWLGRSSAGSAPLQWLAETINLFATSSFALAVWRLRPVAPTISAGATGVDSSAPIQSQDATAAIRS